MQGKPADLVRSGVDFAELLEQDETEEADDDSLDRRSRRSSSRSLASSRQSLDSDHESQAEEELKAADELQKMEATSKGTVKGSVIGNYLKSSGSVMVPVIIGTLFIVTQFSASFADFWVSFWTKQEELRSYYESQNFTIDDVGPFSSEIDLVKPNGSLVDNSVNGLINGTTGEGETGPIAYLLSTDFCMSIHGVLIILIFTFGIIRSVGFFAMGIRASLNMHNGMFMGLINVSGFTVHNLILLFIICSISQQAPMRFFDTNPSGRILNRFSKDIGASDEILPKALLDSGQIILNMLGAIIVTSTVQPVFLIPVFLLGIAFLFIRKVYLKTSKNIKRLEGISMQKVRNFQMN